MTASEMSKLAGTIKGKLTGIPQLDGNIRVGQIISVEGLSAVPPTVLVGDASVSRPMRVLGNIWSYHPGDTVMWQDQTGAPLVIGVLSGVGSESDPTDDEFVPWRLVGGAGEPTFQNSWVNYDTANFNAAGFWMQEDGWVRLQGLVKDGTATVGTTIFQLPDGYQPAFTCYFNINSNSHGAIVRIGTDRNVRVDVFSENDFVSLEGIVFPASVSLETSILSRDYYKFNPGRWDIPQYFTNWFSGQTLTDSEVMFYVRNDGWVWTRGILRVTAVPGNGLVLPDRAAMGCKAQLIPVMGFGVSRHDVGGSVDPRNPRLWRVQAGGTPVDHYIGGLNWIGSGNRTVTHDGPGWNVAFQNNWTNFGLDWMFVQYYKDSHGVVHVYGLAQGSASTSDVIFTLPVGYRPAKRCVFNGMWNSLQGRTNIHPDGRVEAFGHPNNTYHTLSGGITFRAMQ